MGDSHASKPLNAVALAAVGAAFTLAAHHVIAQSFPIKPVRIITSEPAGINDITTRMIAQGLNAIFKQAVVVDNRGGAGGAIAGEITARAVPDGYTLISYGSSLWLGSDGSLSYHGKVGDRSFDYHIGD